MRNDIGIIVRNRVNVINAMVGRVVHVLVRFVSGHEPPPAIDGVVGFLSVHEADAHAIDSNPVCCDACTMTIDERPNISGGLGEALFHRVFSLNLARPAWHGWIAMPEPASQAGGGQ